MLFVEVDQLQVQTEGGGRLSDRSKKNTQTNTIWCGFCLSRIQGHIDVHSATLKTKGLLPNKAKKRDFGNVAMPFSII